ncbi:MAG: hypothetical protein M3441_19970 [Chloroflexota bacterium]|nr:hypothetical protein [Chloroflexota bacterium]
MRKVYDLLEDSEAIEEIRSGTLEATDFVLSSEHGRFGSSEWWQALEQGDVPVYALEGIISAVFMSGDNDYPEFEIDDGQHKSHWSRVGDDSEYVIGRTVLIEYVVEKLKPFWESAEYAEYAELGLDKAEIVLAIWME